MKTIIKLLVITTILTISITSKSSTTVYTMKKENNQNLKKAASAKVSNFPGYENIPDATTYGYAMADPFVLQNQAGFIEPIYMDRLPVHLNDEYTGVWDQADTGIHNRNYYDGSLHLGIAEKVMCSFFTATPRACVGKQGCGWCGEKNQCIEASVLGPKVPCMRNTFMWKMPSPEWNPLKAPAINIHAVDKEGHSMINLTHEPNFSAADVNKPYKLD